MMIFYVGVLMMILASLTATADTLSRIRVKLAGPAKVVSSIEIQGVKAGTFRPDLWSKNMLNLVPDVRHPLLEPREGAMRNIYAPSAVQIDDGWRVFYGAWDGVPTGNDRIYSALTKDFTEFTDRHTVIEHGDFTHVCNVNALRLKDGRWAMICTGLPRESILNKPTFFASPDGKIWNGSPEPYAAKLSDIVTINGYPHYADADINGMNVILLEGGTYHLYFSNFKDFGKVYRASGTDGKHYDFDGTVLIGRVCVNDIKKFRVNGRSWYLMGLHQVNTDTLRYSLSTDSSNFPGTKVLSKNLTEADAYIVAIGWVTDGAQERSGRRVLGYLYGAGADPNLATNRIFARWLQKKVVLESDNGKSYVGSRSYGPDRQLINLREGKSIKGRLKIYADDGRTLLGESQHMLFQPGNSYCLGNMP